MLIEIFLCFWYIVGFDLFYFDGFEYLFFVDYYFKFIFVRKILLGKSVSKIVIELMK